MPKLADLKWPLRCSWVNRSFLFVTLAAELRGGAGDGYVLAGALVGRMKVSMELL